MRHFHIARQRRFVDGETVILAGNHDPAAGQVDDRMIRAVMAEFHLQRLRANGQAENLVAEANAEQRNLALDELARRGDRVIAGLRIARAVREEHAIRLQCQRVAGGGLRRHDDHFAAAIDQHAQDIALDAEIVGDDAAACVPAARTAVRSRS